MEGRKERGREGGTERLVFTEIPQIVYTEKKLLQQTTLADFITTNMLSWRTFLNLTGNTATCTCIHVHTDVHDIRVETLKGDILVKVNFSLSLCLATAIQWNPSGSILDTYQTLLLLNEDTSYNQDTLTVYIIVPRYTTCTYYYYRHIHVYM